MKLKYLALVCGGIGPDVWDSEFEVEAENMLEAVKLIYKDKPHDSDIIEIEQVD